MQGTQHLLKFSKKKKGYEEAGEEVGKRKKVNHRSGSHKFKNKFLNDESINSLSYDSLYN